MNLEIIPIYINKEIYPNDKLADILVSSVKGKINDGDILVITQKIVSKQEGQIVNLSTVIPSILSVGIAAEYNKDPKLVEVILSQTKRIVRMSNRVLIVETKHGFICANAGVDESNIEQGYVTLLPSDPDKSAQQIQSQIQEKTGKIIAVLISDTFGRAFRMGQTNCAIGVAGIETILDYAGTQDNFGKTLRVTAIAIADEICAATELVMGKNLRCPAAIVRNYKFKPSNDTAKALIRQEKEDLFR